MKAFRSAKPNIYKPLPNSLHPYMVQAGRGEPSFHDDRAAASKLAQECAAEGQTIAEVVEAHTGRILERYEPNTSEGEDR
jgi:hypothetical protein